MPELSVLVYMCPHPVGVCTVSECTFKCMRYGIDECTARQCTVNGCKLLFQHKVSQEDVMRGRSEQNVLDAVHDLASGAHRHLQIVRCQCSGPSHLQSFSFKPFSPSLSS